MESLIHRRGVTASIDGTAFAEALSAAPPLECCGCPDSEECREYCVANYGSRGGYCEGFLDLRCVCIY